MTDPVADMLTRLRNANSRSRDPAEYIPFAAPPTFRGRVE